MTEAVQVAYKYVQYEEDIALPNLSCKNFNNGSKINSAAIHVFAFLRIVFNR